jgi:2-polyprenyl-3-methyl-5-hydroxy-6-metoxy-1,4-benzoquinol methylase/tetratricopeptide (TPR) repeat protein
MPASAPPHMLGCGAKAAILEACLFRVCSAQMNRKDRRARQKHGDAQLISHADRLFAVAHEHHMAGRLDEARNTFRAVLGFDPTHADALNGLGILAHQCGHTGVGIDLIGQAIAANNRVARYHYNIGLLYTALGRMDKAAMHNRRAIALEPDWTDAHTNLAAALLADGKAEESVGVAARGLAVKETDDLKHYFAHGLIALRSIPKIPGIRMLIERAMSECWVGPEELSTSFAALVKQNEAISACIERSGSTLEWTTARAIFGSPGLAAIANDRLLHCLMVSAPICDVALERLLTNARRAMLDLATATTDVESDIVVKFCCALAQQCFINEYVFDCTDEEQNRARVLRDRLARALRSKDTVCTLSVAAVAAYFPLHSMDVPPSLFARSWPDAVARLIVQQVHEPAEERSFRSSIAALTPIAETSALVRQQYEENPYPRWVGALSLDTHLTFDKRMSVQFPKTAFAKLGKTEVEILIAGCGTGRHAIQAKRQHIGARILAIDLSLASLAYAQRKARELGLANVEFGQADILQLGCLGRTFDVIEAIGVLHHLRDPLEGWRVLLALLRPGGFMKIGLYSALARQQVSAARAYIAARGYGATPEAIRQCRQDILSSEDSTLLKKTALSRDFFTVSSCRDLLFHVQEHHTSIPAIKAFLAANHLTFLGFEGVPRNQYAKFCPHDIAMTDLDGWHKFETSHPTTFSGMYQFWLQSPAKAAAADEKRPG